MRAEAGVRPVRRGSRARVSRGRSRLVLRLLLWSAVAAAVLLLVLGVVFAGSSSRIPAGVTVAGVDVGGLTTREAEAKLSRLAERYESIPVVFTAGENRWSIRPERLEVRVDWELAAAKALAEGDGPLPLRGLERLKVRLFGSDLAPSPSVFERGLEFELNRIGSAVETAPRDAAIRLQSLEPVVVPGRAGAELDRKAAAEEVVSALAGFQRARVVLPVRVEEPEVTAAALAPVAAQLRTVLSAPVRVRYGQAGWRVRPAELAPLLRLPANGTRDLRIAGPAAERWLDNFSRGVQRQPASADFAVNGNGKVRVLPSRPGQVLDEPATAEALLAAASRPRNRTAQLVVVSEAPPLTTREARALRIERQLASYTTLYSGTPDRIQNLQRAVALLDGARIPPGATFSFNDRVGPRTEERGFRLAPVIVGNEYDEGVGGGVSQVATTVFNAAWEAGLRLTERAAHALYIDRYPLGRDATVNYPDLDLKFRNDTGRWLVLKAGYDESGIVIRLLGAGPERRVVSEEGELRSTGDPPIERTPDPTMFVGERVIVDYGEPSRAVQVTRSVYEGDKALYEETWSTSYRSQPKLVRVGTKPVPVEPPPPPLPPEKGKKETPTKPPPPPPGEGDSGGDGPG
jgi:vancomycin resistance protein YoaR